MEMQKNLFTYYAADYTKPTQDVLTVLESGFYPYVPFTKGMELRLVNKIIRAAPGGREDGNFSERLARYGDAVENPNDGQLGQTIATTTSMMGEFRKEGSEIGKKLSQAITLGHKGDDIPKRLTNRPINIPGEIALDVVAKDIFGRLKDRDANFGKEFESGLKVSKGDSAFDYDPHKKGDEFKAIMSILKDEGIKNTSEYVGLETTMSVGKKFFARFKPKLEKSQTTSQEMWEGSVKGIDKWMQSFTKGFGSAKEVEKARESTITDYSEGPLYMQRQILDRLSLIFKEIESDATKDKFLYHMPLQGENKMWTMAGLAAIGIRKVGEKYEGYAENAGLIDMGVFGSLDNLLIKSAIRQNLITVSEAEVLHDLRMSATSNEGLVQQIDDISIGLISRAKVNVASEFDGAITVAKVLSTKQLATSIIQSFENYSDEVVKDPKFKNIVKESLGKSNKLTKVWKERAYTGLPQWRNGNFSKEHFDDTAGNTQGVWAQSMKPSWNTDSGRGQNLAISPYFLESKKRIALKFADQYLTRSERKLPESSGINI
jgi:hypothetical protein